MPSLSTSVSRAAYENIMAAILSAEPGEVSLEISASNGSPAPRKRRTAKRSSGKRGPAKGSKSPKIAAWWGEVKTFAGRHKITPGQARQLFAKARKANCKPEELLVR